MPAGTIKRAESPRVFLSYARADGERFATQLRQRLLDENIPLWQDRIGMEGGKDWWLQITEALDVVEFLVLVMTPAAMGSETVRKEWRYARQQGCVFIQSRESLILTLLACHTGCAVRISTTSTMNGPNWSTI